MKKYFSFLTLLIGILLILVSCRNGSENEPLGLEKPNVLTVVVTEVTDARAICGGNVTSDGGAEVTAKGVCWSTSQNPAISDSFSIDGVGLGEYVSIINGLTANTTYYVRAYATNSEGTTYGEEKTFTTLEIIEENSINGHEYVDLGLPSGLKWATCNVGAETPEAYGTYYAWGMTVPPTNNSFYPEYCSTYELEIGDISGDVQYDVAASSWGATWRMPTRDEFIELRVNTICESTIQNGVLGYKMTGPNGNHLFLPAAGYYKYDIPYYEGMYGSYWTSTPNENNMSAYYFGFVGEDYYYNNSSSRYEGQTVRAVSY